MVARAGSNGQFKTMRPKMAAAPPLHNNDNNNNNNNNINNNNSSDKTTFGQTPSGRCNEVVFMLKPYLHT